MNRMKGFNPELIGEGSVARGMRPFGKTLIAALCAALMAFFIGCSSKKTPSVVVSPVDPNKKDIAKVVTALDSLVSANKGKGKGVVTGFLTGEGKTIAQGLLKQATNAGGERRLLTMSEIPLTGATVLIFNALKPTTVADTTLKTDSLGNYTCVLDEGKYFGFAVYLDLETFQLVTTSIPNMNPKADTVVKMDTATAIEDVTAPTVSGVYDASTANSSGVFLVGSVPATDAKINITFSEPMGRESAKGVILGTVDTSGTSTSMVLADTVKGVKMTWSGDSKELTLNVASLTVGAQYGIILPVSLKDLAKNPLDKEYKATFVTAAAKDLAAVKFAVSSTFPADKESIKPIQNPGVSFNRPVETFSVLRNAKIDPAVDGYWEISGARAVFIHKAPFDVGKTYTVTMPTLVTDLSGQGLASDYSYSFTVKDFDGAAKDGSGKEKDVALTVESAFDAYLQGDIGRFGAAFHANFRLYNGDGSMKSKSEFLDMVRKDAGDAQAMAAGFDAPVFDNSDSVCKDGGMRWKVGAVGGTADDILWVDAYVTPGNSPRVYGSDKTEISRSDLQWDPTGPRFTYKTKKYGFGPDMSNFHGPVNMDAAKGDQRFMGDMLRQTSTVVLEPVKLTMKTEFKVDPAITINGDTAKLAVKMIDYRTYNRVNFGQGDLNCKSALSDTTYQMLLFTLVNDGSKWLVLNIISPDKKATSADDLNKSSVSASDFQVKQIMPILLTAPVNGKDNAADANGKVTFKFNGVKLDSVGGYIVGLAEDPKFCGGRPAYGTLIFVKASKHDGTEESFTLNSLGQPDGSNATVILRRAQDLKLPGWDRTMFEFSINKLINADSGFAGVYNWKAIAVKDTSAAQFLGYGFSPDRFYGESDFGSNRGYFAVKAFPQGAAFAQFNNQVFVQPATGTAGAPMGFGDMDQDGFPDGMEQKYHTDPKDRNSYPDFRVDTDGDKLADFLEALLDPTGKDSLVTKKATPDELKAEIAKLQAMGILWQDSDGDGFPDDYEQMTGFNPFDANSNPGSMARATAPIGVFSGKYQMGSNQYSFSCKLYSDTSKKYMVAYTAYAGKDTLTDTVRADFMDMMGEVHIAINLPKNGPDSGKAMLLRGHFDPNQSLIQGGVELVKSVAKTSVDFGGGPMLGMFAASGRGEDVSRFFPNNNGGPAMPNNPGNPIGSPIGGPVNTFSYRLPPTGTSEGSKIIFAGGVITMIDDFGDTVAVVGNLQFRGQPDGGFDFSGNVQVNNLGDYKMSDVGGHIAPAGDGWVIDGHIYQESMTAGVKKSIPGQMCAKGAKADIKVVNGMIEGTFGIGWIAQDKTGAGFTGPALPICPTATATNCQMPPGGTTPCDPAKGPCNTNPPPCDPSKGPCGTMQPPPPTNSFSRPFMGGTATYFKDLGLDNVKAGDYFFVSMNGHVYKVKNDSTHIMDGKMPFCGQVVIVPELISAKDDSAAHIQGYFQDSLNLAVSGTLVILIEDQFMPGVPARMDKARDGQGDVHANLYIVEMRPKPMDYGTSAMACGPVGQPPVACDPTKGPCTNPPPPCDPAKGPCGPVVGGGGPAFYSGTLDALNNALKASTNVAVQVKDSGVVVGRVTLDIASIVKNPVGNGYVGKDSTGHLFGFLGVPSDATKLLIKDNMPIVVGVSAGTPPPSTTTPPPSTTTPPPSTTTPPPSTTTPPPSTTTPPPSTTTPPPSTTTPPPSTTTPPPSTTTPPPGGDTTKPVFYQGDISVLSSLLASKNNKVIVASPNGPVGAVINPSSIQAGVGMVTAHDAASATVYVFMGTGADPKKPFLSADGMVVVTVKL